jgi:two-component system sensor histidine kinase MprB
MGARTLERRLRDRLLAVTAPAFAGVAIASVIVTARSLEAADSDVAAMHARGALRMLKDELTEGDPLELALHEAIAETEADGVRIAIRHKDAPVTAGKEAMVGGLAQLAAGSCASAEDERGRAWRACAAEDGDFDAVVAIDVENHRAVVRTLLEAMLVVVLAMVLAAVVAVRLALRKPLASLRALVAWSERVVSTEGAPPSPPVADTPEIARLTTSFDALVHRLLDALGRERANSAHIAHELRTPLTAIRAELEAMPSTGADAVARMRADVASLARVIDAILILSAPAEAHTRESVVNVADVVRELVTHETNVEAPDEALVDADPRLVELALQNLLENARKYSGRAARSVSVTRADAGVRVAVRDDGPGVDEETRAKMFERYWRGTRDREGSGLGLALVRAVAERHGGTAEASPNPTGRGLEVAITFGRVVGWHEGEAR